MTPKWKHPNDLSAEELRELVGSMSLMALDLAQHLAYSGMDKRITADSNLAAAWEQATRMAYELSGYPYDGPTLERTNPPGLLVFGEKGLEL